MLEYVGRRLNRKKEEHKQEEDEAEHDETSARRAQLRALRAATRLQLSHERLARRAAQEKLNEQVRTRLMVRDGGGRR